MSLNPLDFAVFFLGWFFQAFTGFGAGIFIVGILSIPYNPKTVIVSSAPINFFGTFFMSLLLLRRVKPRLRILSLLILGSIPGIFIGTKVLVGIDKDTLRVLIGSFILFLGLYDLLVQKGILEKLSLRESLWGSLGAGFLGGFFAGLIGMGGPPPVVYLNQVLEDIEEFKSTLTMFFTSNIIFRMVFYWSEGGLEYLSPDMILTGALAIPLGVYGGLALSRRVNPYKLKVFISASVIVLGVALVIKPQL